MCVTVCVTVCIEGAVWVDGVRSPHSDLTSSDLVPDLVTYCTI